MLLIDKQVYNRNAPRFSREANVDILPIAKWFGEDTFTYIRVFGSISSPHVFPYYVLDKLMAREIAYQTSAEGGLSKGLKEHKRPFGLHFRCNVVCLHYMILDMHSKKQRL